MVRLGFWGFSWYTGNQEAYGTLQVILQASRYFILSATCVLDEDAAIADLGGCINAPQLMQDFAPQS